MSRLCFVTSLCGRDREFFSTVVLISGVSPDKDEQSGESPLLCRVQKLLSL